ncbi:MAG: adhesin [Chloroflexi bacterium]|nr:adhesin [Chloroflexota bacterium]
MITVTERAAAELEGLLGAQGAPSGQGVKLVPDQTGGVGVTISAPTTGDEVVPRGEVPLLIVDASLTQQLDGVVLDVEPAAGAGGERPPQFVLRRPDVAA